MFGHLCLGAGLELDGACRVEAARLRIYYDIVYIYIYIYMRIRESWCRPCKYGSPGWRSAGQ